MGNADGKSTERVTMRRIAELAEVSRPAVSAVLQNTPGIRVSRATRERVLTIARELNYRPNFAANALKRGKTGLIGLIVGGLHLPFYAELATRLNRKTSASGRHLLLSPIDWERHDDLENLDRMIDMTDGVFMCSGLMHRHPEAIERVRRRGKPFVMINTRASGLCGVYFDLRRGMAKAMRTLYDLGHRRIARIASAFSSGTDRVYREECRALDIEPVIHTQVGGEDPGKNMALIKDLAQNWRRQTAIVVSDFGLKLLQHAVAEGGFSVPRDLSVVLFSSVTVEERLLLPSLCTVVMDCETLAQCSMEVMEGMLADDDAPRHPESVLLQCDFLPGESVAAPREDA